MIYFAPGGLGFGFAENILYTLADGAGTGIGRLIIVSFFHAVINRGCGLFCGPRSRPRDYQSGLRAIATGRGYGFYSLYDFRADQWVRHVCPGRCPKFVRDHWHVCCLAAPLASTLLTPAPPVGGSCLQPMQFVKNCLAKGPGPIV